MALIEFENNTDEIIEEMRHKALAWLEEAGGDIRLRQQRIQGEPLVKLREASNIRWTKKL